MNFWLTESFAVLLLALAGWYLWEKWHRKTHPLAGGLRRDICLPHEQEYELYHNALSLCSKKVRVCLAELNIDYKSHQIDLIETGSYETISRKFLAVNPAGTVPVLVHNGHPVYESHDIISYCAQQVENDGVQLVPRDRTLQQIMERWKKRASIEGDNPVDGLVESAANCVALLTTPLFCAGIEHISYGKIVEGLLFHRIKFRPLFFLFLKIRGLTGFVTVKPLMKQLAKGKHYMGQHLDALDQHLASHQPWICGDQFTLADISWMVIFERLCEADWFDYFFHDNRRPHVFVYWQRLRQRQGYIIGIDACRHPSVERATLKIIEQKNADDQFKVLLEAG